MDDTLELKPLAAMATATTFTKRKVDSAGATLWTAPSPLGDIEGTFTLRRASQKTKANIVSRSLHLTMPIPKADATGYLGTTQARIVLNAPATASIEGTQMVLEMLLSALTDLVHNPDMADNFVLGL